MRSPLLAGVLVSVALAASADAAPAATTVIGRSPSPDIAGQISVAAHRGVSAFTVERSGRFSFRVVTGTGTEVPAVRSFAAAPALDMGPGPDRRVTVTYSRCAEPREGPAMGGRSCRVYRYTPGRGERRVRLRLPKGTSAVLPSIWGARIAVVTYRDADTSKAPDLNSAPFGPPTRIGVYSVRTGRLLRVLPGGPRKRIPAISLSGRVVTKTMATAGVPTGLDLREDRVAYTWRYRSSGNGPVSTRAYVASAHHRRLILRENDVTETCWASIVGPLVTARGATVGSLSCSPGIYALDRGAAKATITRPIDDLERRARAVALEANGDSTFAIAALGGDPICPVLSGMGSFCIMRRTAK